MAKKEVDHIFVDNQNVSITNRSKILFPKAKITKGAFVDYYERIAPLTMPHITDRLLSMFRFPNGIDGSTFFQKDVKESVPDWIEVVSVEKSDGQLVNYICFSNAASLLYVANLVCVPHIWLSRAKKIDYPDRMIFDLDPAGKATFSLVMWTAKKVKKMLDDLELPSFVMTTGSRGLHVVVPLKQKEHFDDVRACSKAIAQQLVDQYPSKLTLEMRKDKRGDRIFLDYLRNAFSATTVAPYAIRAKAGAPIATPLHWSEITSGLSSRKYHIKNIFKRMARKEDPWADINAHAVSLKKVMVHLSKRIGRK